MIEQWKADFKKSDNMTIAYTGVGSGAGRSQLIAGTVDFAGSDTLASADETNQLKSKYGDFVYIPETSGGIAVMFEVSGLSSLKLSGPTLAKIFGGTITNWNDPAIAADNGAAGPNKPIQVFVRSDKSGTSGVFTDYLTKTAPAEWTKGKTETFPTDKGQIGKAASDGVSNAVAASDGGIGYADFAFGRKLRRLLGEEASPRSPATGSSRSREWCGCWSGPTSSSCRTCCWSGRLSPRRSWSIPEPPGTTPARTFSWPWVACSPSPGWASSPSRGVAAPPRTDEEPLQTRRSGAGIVSRPRSRVQNAQADGEADALAIRFISFDLRLAAWFLWMIPLAAAMSSAFTAWRTGRPCPRRRRRRPCRHSSRASSAPNGPPCSVPGAGRS